MEYKPKLLQSRYIINMNTNCRVFNNRAEFVLGNVTYMGLEKNNTGSVIILNIYIRRKKLFQNTNF